MLLTFPLLPRITKQCDPIMQPHAQSPSSIVHPHATPSRITEGGTEGSSMHPQARSQTSRPDLSVSGPMGPITPRRMEPRKIVHGGDQKVIVVLVFIC